MDINWVEVQKDTQRSIDSLLAVLPQPGSADWPYSSPAASLLWAIHYLKKATTPGLGAVIRQIADNRSSLTSAQIIEVGEKVSLLTKGAAAKLLGSGKVSDKVAETSRILQSASTQGYLVASDIEEGLARSLKHQKPVAVHVYQAVPEGVFEATGVVVHPDVQDKGSAGVWLGAVAGALVAWWLIRRL